MDISALLPARSPADFIRGIARFELGGQEHTLPVLSIEDNEQWLANIDGQLRGVLDGLEIAGDDMPRLFGLLTSQTPALLALLKSYDKGDTLGTIEDIRHVTRPHELLLAVLAIWRAANPLVDIGLMALGMSGANSGPMSSQPVSTDGSPQTSADDSPTSNSSPTSIALSTVLRPTKNGKYRPIAQPTSSPRTRSSGNATGPGQAGIAG
jgi:hypothetical protein